MCHRIITVYIFTDESTNSHPLLCTCYFAEIEFKTIVLFIKIWQMYLTIKSTMFEVPRATCNAQCATRKLNWTKFWALLALQALTIRASKCCAITTKRAPSLYLLVEKSQRLEDQFCIEMKTKTI